MCSVNGVKSNSPNTEEDIENVERKMAEVYEKKLKDLERKFFLQDKILKEHERKLEMQNEIMREQARTLQFQRQPPQRVIFSTQLAESKHNIDSGKKIVFDRVDLNEGLGYDKNTGDFRAPQSGVYMFAYFLGHGYAADQVWLELMHNGDRINAGVVDTFHDNQDTQGGNLAFVHLKEGDYVYLQVWHDGGVYLDADGYITFSGALLHQM